MENRIELPASKLIENINLNVTVVLTGLKFAQFRMFVGAKIIKFGAWVIGCKVTVCDKDGNAK